MQQGLIEKRALGALGFALTATLVSGAVFAAEADTEVREPEAREATQPTSLEPAPLLDVDRAEALDQQTGDSEQPESAWQKRGALDLKRTLEEAALDLEISARVVDAEELDAELARRKQDEQTTWLLAQRLTPIGELWRVEITAVPPASEVRRVVADVVDPARIEVRAIVLLRQAVQSENADATALPTTPSPPETPAPRSAGRAVLALNTALLGGAVGVSLHYAGASADNRLLYPLAALGVGIGLGASMLIADEWDITTDDAWFLSAGMVWPATSGVLLAAHYGVSEDYRYLYGLSGTAVGVTLATLSVASHRVSEGSATLAHSGAVLGMGMGALAEGMVRGDLQETPLGGMGYGTGIGVLAAGLVATQMQISSSRVLLVDLAALLGGLTGGAVATPLLLVDDVDDARRRLWFGSVALGTTVGAVLGMMATHDDDALQPTGQHTPHRQGLITRWAPQAGVIGFSEEGTRRVPAFGAGVQGLW